MPRVHQNPLSFCVPASSVSPPETDVLSRGGVCCPDTCRGDTIREVASFECRLSWGALRRVYFEGQDLPEATSACRSGYARNEQTKFTDRVELSGEEGRLSWALSHQGRGRFGSLRSFPGLVSPTWCNHNSCSYMTADCMGEHDRTYKGRCPLGARERTQR